MVDTVKGVPDFLDLGSMPMVVQAGQSGVQWVTQPVEPHTDMKVPDMKVPDMKVPDIKEADMEEADIEVADIEVADSYRSHPGSTGHGHRLWNGMILTVYQSWLLVCSAERPPCRIETHFP